jgi:predicted transcriptional regulator
MAQGLRKKRYKPDKSWEDKAWRFTDLDREILLLLVRYRYLRGRYIAALLGRKRVTINFALSKLHGVGYVVKPRAQYLGWNSLNDSDIYELAPAGKKRLKTDITSATNLLHHEDDRPNRQFHHAMMICDTLSSIEIGVRKAGLTFITEAEVCAFTKVKDPLRLPIHLRHTFENGKTEDVTAHMRPDAVFGIRYENGKTRLFLLECEHYSAPYRNTFVGTSSMKKIVAYKDLKKGDVLIKHLGKRHFTPLFVFPFQPDQHEKEQATGKLLTNVSKVAALLETHSGGHSFYLKTVPVQEEILQAPYEFPEIMFDDAWLVPGKEPEFISKPLE